MKKILLVESDASIRQALAQVLASEHYEVIAATTTSEAASRFIAEKPDLILLDPNQPDQDDGNFSNPAGNMGPGIPVIVITNKSYRQVRASGLLADAIMEKPLDIPLLLNVIRKCLAERTPEDSGPETPAITPIETK